MRSYSSIFGPTRIDMADIDILTLQRFIAGLAVEYKFRNVVAILIKKKNNVD